MTEVSNKLTMPKETPEEIEFELRAHIGSVWAGGRLFIGIYTFIFASLAFAYFYLRSSNNGELWRPHNVTAPTAFGWTIYSLMLLSAFMAGYGQRRLRKGEVTDWQVAGWVGVASGMLALFLQLWEFHALTFFPGSSGYASTFIGFAVVNVATIGVCTYWLETTLARGLRLTKELNGESPATSKNPSARSFRANVASMTYFFGFIALASTMFLLMFYVL